MYTFIVKTKVICSAVQAVLLQAFRTNGHCSRFRLSLVRRVPALQMLCMSCLLSATVPLHQSLQHACSACDREDHPWHPRHDEHFEQQSCDKCYATVDPSASTLVALLEASL